MCEPMTIAVLGAGFATQAVGGYLSEQGKAKASDAAARDESLTASHLRRAAGDARVRGDIGAQEALLQGGQVAGRARAAYGASGVDVASGSAQDVLATTAAMARLDAQTVQNNAAREAWGFQEEAKQHDAMANFRREEAHYHRTWGTGLALLGPATSLLGNLAGAKK